MMEKITKSSIKKNALIMLAKNEEIAIEAYECYNEGKIKELAILFEKEEIMPVNANMIEDIEYCCIISEDVYFISPCTHL